jgi:hypothetical protein
VIYAGTDSLKWLEEGKKMILNAPPALMRIYTQPKEATSQHPYDMAGWWLARRAERTEPVDSANPDPNSLGRPPRSPSVAEIVENQQGQERHYATGYTVAISDHVVREMTESSGGFLVYGHPGDKGRPQEGQQPRQAASSVRPDRFSVATTTTGSAACPADAGLWPPERELIVSRALG